MHFPYLNETQSDLYGKANALTFWLCDRMTRKLGGQLTIKARESLGTRYTLHLKCRPAKRRQRRESICWMTLSSCWM